MTQTLLVEKTDAGQETISQEEVQRKIIMEQSLKLLLYYGEGTIPLEREGTTHIITIKRDRKAVTQTGQTLELTEQETDSLGQYVYQQLMTEYSQGKTVVPSPSQAETSQEQEEEITQKDSTIQKQAQSIEKLQAKLDKIHEVQANTNMSYSDRTLMTLGIFTHPDEFLDLKPFILNVSRLQTESGVGQDTMTNFLASLHDAHAIKYHNKPNKKEDGGFNSASTVVPLPDYAHANTKAAARRVKQREKVTERRLSRGIPPTACENCGSVDPNEAYAAIVPFCEKCQHVASNKQERVLAKNVRIIEIVTTGPSPEFSETQSEEEWIDGDEEVIQSNNQEEAAPSPEFSEIPASDLDSKEIQEPSPEFSDNPNSPFSNDALVDEFIRRLSTVENLDTLASEPPSPEFSEGDRVSTSVGIGIVSFIGEFQGRKRYRIKLGTKQPDGTYYRAFNESELEPIVQAELLREE